MAKNAKNNSWTQYLPQIQSPITAPKTRIAFQLPITVGKTQPKGQNNGQQQPQNQQKGHNSGHQQPKIDKVAADLMKAYADRLANTSAKCVAEPIIIRGGSIAVGKRLNVVEGRLGEVIYEVAKFMRSFEWIVSIYEANLDDQWSRVYYAEVHQVGQDQLGYTVMGAADMQLFVNNQIAEQSGRNLPIYRVDKDDVVLPKTSTPPVLPALPTPPAWLDEDDSWHTP